MIGRHGRWPTLIGLAVLLTGSVTEAHPFHVTWAEAEWNSETGMLEVALRVHPGDLENVLRQRTQQQILLADASAEKAVEEYLRETFRFMAPQGAPVSWSWVGYEVTVPAAWLYFEVPLAEGPDGATIVNQLLLHIPRQVNTVHVRQGKRQATLEFSADHTSRRIELD